jgi:hypothetical protein
MKFNDKLSPNYASNIESSAYIEPDNNTTIPAAKLSFPAIGQFVANPSINRYFLTIKSKKQDKKRTVYGI